MMVYPNSARSNIKGSLAPEAPIEGTGEVEGYLQISLARDGTFEARGSRLLMDWLLHRLAADGWQIELDDIHWCG